MKHIKVIVLSIFVGVLFTGCFKKTTEIPHGLIVDYIRMTGDTASGDLQLLQNILVENAELEARQDTEVKPIHVAAWKKTDEDLSVFSDYQLRRQRNKKTTRKWTPLHFAALSGNQEFVERLLKVKASPSKKDHAQMTPLHIAAAAGHREIVALLIEAGSDVNATSSNGWTPHAMAARGGHAESAELLRSLGAVPSTLDLAALNIASKNPATNAKNLFGETELHLALLWHPESIQQQLKNRSLVNSAAIYNITPLHIATLSGKTDVVKNVLSRGADPKTPPGIDSPLHWAAKNDYVDVMNLLLKNGSDKNAYGFPRISLSLQKGDSSEFVIIVETKNKQGQLGWSPLHCAVYYQQEEAVKILLAHGADANFKTSAKNDTPLHWAAFHGNEKLVNLLLAAGAQKKSASPQTPCEVAIAKGHKKIAELLKP